MSNERDGLSERSDAAGADAVTATITDSNYFNKLNIQRNTKSVS